MEKPGFILSAPPGQRKAIIEAAQELERRGFPHVLCPHEYARPHEAQAPYDCLSLCTALAQATQTIRIVSGVAVTYTRPPADMAAAASFNYEISDGRFMLGLGSGYKTVLERFGIKTEPPIPHMRRYVEDLRAAATEQPLPPILLAALRRRMAALAGEIGDGLIGGNWALSRVPVTLASIPAPQRNRLIIANVAPVYLCDDRAEGLAFMRRLCAAFVRIPTYAAYFSEAGYQEEVERAQSAFATGTSEAADAISERMADDIGIFGPPNDIRDRVEAWRAAGVNWLTLSTLYPIRDRAAAVIRVATIFD